MDTTAEQQYAGSGADGAKAAKLGSKQGTNRDGGRGASQDVVDQGQQRQTQPGFSFFGDAAGRNDDTQNKPEDRGHKKSTLDAPQHGGGY